MLAVLRAFAAVAPQIIDRDQRGEWKGFPLKTQPSTRGRIHPEEPDDLVESFTWLNSRPPNGDARLVVGQVTVDGVRHLLGYTVVGQLLAAAFVEPAPQVMADIVRGFSYFSGDPTGHLEIDHDSRNRPRGAPSFRTVSDISDWATPLSFSEWDEDWGVDLSDTDWARLVRYAQRDYLPDALRYEARRAQRLNA